MFNSNLNRCCTHIYFEHSFLKIEQQEETDISTSPSEPSDSIDDVDDHDDDIASSIQPYAFEPMVDTSDITTNIGRGGGGRGE